MLQTFISKNTVNNAAVVPSDNPSNPVNGVSFSEIVKSMPKCAPVVVLKPRNSSQTRKITMVDVNTKLDSNCNGVSNIRNASNGGIIIECESIEDSQKIKNMAEKKLGDSYSVNVPTSRAPMVRIIGISSFYEDNILLEYIKSHNPKIFSSDSTIKVLQRYRFSRSDTFGVKLEVDAEAFAKCMHYQRIRIHWEMCKVHEAFGIIRCFKCNEFNHVYAKCPFEVSCPRCSGNHEVTVCKSTEIKCINCKKAAESLKVDIDTSHPAWSENCPVYLEKVKIERHRINYNPAAPPL